MVDYEIDEDFQLVRTGYGQISEVRGKSEFEQSIVFALHTEGKKLLRDETSRNNVKSKIRLLVNRIARQSKLIDSVEKLNVSKAIGSSGTLRVAIEYNTDDNFQTVI